MTTEQAERYRGPDGAWGKPIYEWEEDRHYAHTHGAVESDDLGGCVGSLVFVVLSWWAVWLTLCVMAIARNTGVALPPFLPWL